MKSISLYTMKKCCSCKNEKSLSEFYTNKTTKDGYQTVCIECNKKRYDTKKHEKEFKQKRIDYGRQYKKENRESIREKHREYKKTPRARQLAKEYRKTHPSTPEQRKVRREQRKQRLEENPHLKIAKSIRCRIRKVLKGKSKSAKTLKLLGCDFEFFKLHLESYFTEGMSWDNYGKGEGKWCIDHIVPCNLYDLNITEHQENCFHFSNQQPLWWIENNEKGDRLLEHDRLTIH